MARQAADAPTIAQLEQTLSTSVGNPAFYDLILGTVTGSLGLEAPKSLGRPSPAQAIEALARGCDLFRALNRPLIVPPTLLAQVDSSIGGKVGVNHALGKNLIGAFHQPAAVLIDPLLLRTLPRREFRAGLYEVIKYGVIASSTLLDRIATSLTKLFDRDADAVAAVVGDSCRIKADVVSADERESGARRTLNFGHTVGHALEAVTKYRRFRHGEAVAYGMLAALALGVQRKVLVVDFGGGTLDLAANAFRGLGVRARLLDPAALFPDMTGRSVLLDARFEGPFATARFDYAMTADRFAFVTNEAGGTSWLYISDVPLEQLGMPEGLDQSSYPQLASTALGAVPMILTLWPPILMGLHAITKRREEEGRHE